MSRYCLDTSAYSHFKRGKEEICDLVDEAVWIGVPTVVLGELWSGFRQGKQQRRNESELNEFLRHPAVEPVSVDAEVGSIYAAIVVALRSAGTPLPTNDIWIAACAVRSGSVVLTFDPHFRLIEQAGSLILS